MNIAATFISEDALWVEDDLLHGQMKWSNEGWIFFFSYRYFTCKDFFQARAEHPSSSKLSWEGGEWGHAPTCTVLEVGLVCPWSKSGPSVSVGIWITDSRINRGHKPFLCFLCLIIKVYWGMTCTCPYPETRTKHVCQNILNNSLCDISSFQKSVLFWYFRRAI